MTLKFIELQCFTPLLLWKLKNLKVADTEEKPVAQTSKNVHISVHPVVIMLYKK